MKYIPITDQRTIDKRQQRKSFLLRQGARLTRHLFSLGQDSFETMLAKCDPRSPIEPIFLRAAYDQLTPLGLFCAQYEILGYRADFAILTGGGLKLVVECDGREFHFTEPQISYDNDRDAELRGEGWMVQRLTGSKIYRDAAGCADQIERLVRRLR